MILRAAVLAAAALAAGAAHAQEDPASLADLRGQLQALAQEMQALRSELVASGAEGFQAAGGDSAIDRMNRMEQQISQLTGQTEQLQYRIKQIVSDGTQRIADLEFRLCEMDPACDLGALMTVPDLGSASADAGGPPRAVAPPDPEGKAPTTAEQQDFDQAQRALGEGDFERAAQLFATVASEHAGGPLTSEALFLRGSALDSAGQADQAAAAWLEAFAADPGGARASESLLGLARLASDAGDQVGACLYLAEIPVRFGGSDAAIEANRRMLTLACGAAEMPEGDVAPMDPEAAADLNLDE